MTAEIENFDGIFSSPAISEAIPSTNTQPSVFPCPESSTIPQISPDMVCYLHFSYIMNVYY